MASKAQATDAMNTKQHQSTIRHCKQRGEEGNRQEKKAKHQPLWSACCRWEKGGGSVGERGQRNFVFVPNSTGKMTTFYNKSLQFVT